MLKKNTQKKPGQTHVVLALKANGGDEENRTPDPLLARQVLSQLSYAPNCKLDKWWRQGGSNS